MATASHIDPLRALLHPTTRHETAQAVFAANCTALAYTSVDVVGASVAFLTAESTILAVPRYTTARTSYRRAAARLSTAAAHASRLCLLVPRRGDYAAGAQSSCRRRVDVSRAPADGVLGEPVAPRLLAHPEAAAAPPLPAPREREASEHTRSHTT